MQNIFIVDDDDYSKVLMPFVIQIKYQDYFDEIWNNTESQEILMITMMKINKKHAWKIKTWTQINF